MLIANITIKNKNEINDYKWKTVRSTNLSKLNKVYKGRYVLSGEKFKHLEKFIKFTKVRIFCQKPSTGRTIHAIYRDDNSLKYLLHQDSENPQYNNVLVRYLYDDNSYRKLEHVTLTMINIKVLLKQRLYDHFFYIPNKSHVIITIPDRLECDDFAYFKEFSPIGAWYFYLK